ncbi:MAG: dihydrodipicolinate synthase family protein [Bacteroidia bacterium]|nr:dihydrodipicolinate synthase family protein [Bacteroidia bacterium]
MNRELDFSVKELLRAGTVIPAHPLALKKNLALDEIRQRRLTRYYMACGAGGVAIGVHTTQFEIRKPEINLLESVLKLAAEEIETAALNRPFIKVAGICGPTPQAIKEAELALRYGYHLGLVSMGGLHDYSESALIKHAQEVSKIIPVFGFYLQSAVGGRVLSYEFWRQFAELPNVHAIKVAAFNRYQTLDVVRAVCNSSRRNEIALFTGNDDNIVADLLTPYQFTVDGKKVEKRFVGGLLGHWAVWTKKAVELLAEVKYCIANNYSGLEKLLSKGIEITDMNGVIFDERNSFKGCIPGIHEILNRQGLLDGLWCLNPEEKLSAGQSKEIDRIYHYYQHHTDDEFVKKFLDV